MSNDITLPRTRAEAITSGASHYFTSKPCLRGHICNRKTIDSACVLCRIARERERTATDQVYREKRRLQSYAYYKAHQAKMLEMSKAWAAKNKKRRAKNYNRFVAQNGEYLRVKWAARRASKRDSQVAPIGITQIADMLAKQTGRCVNCARKFGRAGYHIDHILPLKLGGPHTIENLQLLCAPCNLRKSAKHPVDFAREHGRLL